MSKQERISSLGQRYWKQRKSKNNGHVLFKIIFYHISKSVNCLGVGGNGKRRFGVSNGVDQCKLATVTKLRKLMFRVLALRHSESRNYGLCVVDIYKKWRYTVGNTVGGNMSTQKTTIN